MALFSMKFFAEEFKSLPQMEKLHDICTAYLEGCFMPR